MTALIKRHAANETEAEEMLKDDTLRARLRVAKHFFTVSGRVFIVTARMIAISTLSGCNLAIVINISIKWL